MVLRTKTEKPNKWLQTPVIRRVAMWTGLMLGTNTALMNVANAQEGDGMASKLVKQMTVADALGVLKSASEGERVEQKRMDDALKLITSGLATMDPTKALTDREAMSVYLYTRKALTTETWRGDTQIKNVNEGIDIYRTSLGIVNEAATLGTANYGREEMDALRNAIRFGIQPKIELAKATKTGAGELPEAFNKEEIKKVTDWLLRIQGDPSSSFDINLMVLPVLDQLYGLMTPEERSILPATPVFISGGVSERAQLPNMEEQRIVRVLSTRTGSRGTTVDPGPGLDSYFGDEAGRFATNYIDGLYEQENPGSTGRTAQEIGGELADQLQEHVGDNRSPIINSYCDGGRCRTAEERENANSSLRQAIKAFRDGNIREGDNLLPGEGQLRTDLGEVKRKTTIIDMEKGSAVVIIGDFLFELRFDDSWKEFENWRNDPAKMEALGFTFLSIGVMYKFALLHYVEKTTLLTESRDGPQSEEVLAREGKTESIYHRVGVDTQFAFGVHRKATILVHAQIDQERQSFWFIPYVQLPGQSSAEVPTWNANPMIAVTFEGLNIKTEALQRVEGLRNLFKAQNVEVPAEDIGISAAAGLRFRMDGHEVKLLAVPSYSLLPDKFGDNAESLELKLTYTTPAKEKGDVFVDLTGKGAVSTFGHWVGGGLGFNMKDLLRVGADVSFFPDTPAGPIPIVTGKLELRF